VAGGCEYVNELVFSINVGSSLAIRGTVRFSRRVVFHGVTVFVLLEQVRECAVLRMRMFSLPLLFSINSQKKRSLDPLRSDSGSAVS